MGEDDEHVMLPMELVYPISIKKVIFKELIFVDEIFFKQFWPTKCEKIGTRTKQNLRVKQNLKLMTLQI